MGQTIKINVDGTNYNVPWTGTRIPNAQDRQAIVNRIRAQNKPKLQGIADDPFGLKQDRLSSMGSFGASSGLQNRSLRDLITRPNLDLLSDSPIQRRLSQAVKASIQKKPSTPNRPAKRSPVGADSLLLSGYASAKRGASGGNTAQKEPITRSPKATLGYSDIGDLLKTPEQRKFERQFMPQQPASSKAPVQDFIQKMVREAKEVARREAAKRAFDEQLRAVEKVDPLRIAMAALDKKFAPKYRDPEEWAIRRATIKAALSKELGAMPKIRDRIRYIGESADIGPAAYQMIESENGKRALVMHRIAELTKDPGARFKALHYLNKSDQARTRKGDAVDAAIDHFDDERRKDWSGAQWLASGIENPITTIDSALNGITPDEFEKHASAGGKLAAKGADFLATLVIEDPTRVARWGAKAVSVAKNLRNAKRLMNLENVGSAAIQAARGLKATAVDSATELYTHAKNLPKELGSIVDLVKQGATKANVRKFVSVPKGAEVRNMIRELKATVLDKGMDALGGGGPIGKAAIINSDAKYVGLTESLNEHLNPYSKVKSDSPWEKKAIATIEFANLLRDGASGLKLHSIKDSGDIAKERLARIKLKDTASDIRQGVNAPRQTRAVRDVAHGELPSRNIQQAMDTAFREARSVSALGPIPSSDYSKKLKNSRDPLDQVSHRMGNHIESSQGHRIASDRQLHVVDANSMSRAQLRQLAEDKQAILLDPAHVRELTKVFAEPGKKISEEFNNLVFSRTFVDQIANGRNIVLVQSHDDRFKKALNRAKQAGATVVTNRAR